LPRLLDALVSVRPQQWQPVCGAACADDLPRSKTRFPEDPPACRTGAAGSRASPDAAQAAMPAEKRALPSGALTSCRLLMPALRSKIGRHANVWAHQLRAHLLPESL